MRTDRTPFALAQEHALAFAAPGVNRFRRGLYVCGCGAEFSGMNAYEAHRAEARRTEQQA